MPVLILNPRSGGGKVERFGLVAQCRTRNIEPLVMGPDDDLAALASAAVRDGADALGMAGGDGSQSVVAAVAAEHGLPYVCVPAGTRNHFAFDLGIDRNDLVGSLDAFVAGDERRVDLGRVNGRVFVNNVAMGVYGAVVQSPEYRDHKLRTMIGMLPDLVGPGAEPFDLRFTGRDGSERETAALVLVSNNPYTIDPRPQIGNRGQLDRGELGVLAVVGPPPRGLEEWSTPTFRVDSAATVQLGIDGESVSMSPPLLFESDPLALRVRLPIVTARPRPPRIGGGAASTGRSALPNRAP